MIFARKYIYYYPGSVHVSKEKAQEALSVFREHGGLLRTSEARELGIHPRTLYHLRDSGQLDRLSRGLYRVADLPPLSYPDLTVVAARSNPARICLISALDFHDLTTEVPHAVDVALPGNRRPPTLDHPPIRVFRMSGGALTEGVEHHEIDGVDVKIFGPAKTVADCFKFRNRTGLDTALEGLRTYLEKAPGQTEDLMHYARICRVESVLRPYVEAFSVQ
ncbi:MAG: type IV toxin-antitoxin system AbiEi family antitoxin domain-containing protein [Salinibacter sp.]|uniref:type IV toxin-antitoxin system AbiEi family antitoxin domain-containing protein n=1 Tax=Salinibacter sp. TaxID=2065818 RepID=UPI0035D4A430